MLAAPVEAGAFNPKTKLHRSPQKARGSGRFNVRKACGSQTFRTNQTLKRRERRALPA
jgi:hypothetical protein